MGKRIDKFRKAREQQYYLEETVKEIECKTGKTRNQLTGKDISLCGEGLIGALFDFLGFNDGIEGYHDR